MKKNRAERRALSNKYKSREKRIRAQKKAHASRTPYQRQPLPASSYLEQDDVV
jgi:hypothetical protein